ncbi:hypothetical protein [Thermaurantiacus tibetensis]|uniref:hypothetical protein n=1 Tax=Thermaurantiacus tibetensis TaxID=2759035 RepID=UPI00188EBE5D|nr:hypothetical protein [Thermaurantiacus tibetensis]
MSARLTFILCIKPGPGIATETLDAQLASCLAVRRADVLVGLSEADEPTASALAPWEARGRVHLAVLKDRSLYDGWNRAAALANGEELTFLGLGDCVINPDHFDGADLTGLDALFARALVFDGRRERIFGAPFRRRIHYWRQQVAMVGAILRREFVLETGFDPALHIAGDWEFLLRAGDRMRAGFRPLTVVSMPGGGLSERRFAALMAEVRRVRAERRRR